LDFEVRKYRLKKGILLSSFLFPCRSFIFSPFRCTFAQYTSGFRTMQMQQVRVLCLKSPKTGNLLHYIFHFTFLALPLRSKLKKMANHKATKKDMRQAAKRRERNRYYGKTTRNAIRDLKDLQDKAAAGEQAPEVISMIDKLAKRGVIHKNKASNLKSKLARRMNKLA